MHLTLRHMSEERKQEEPALPGHGCPWKGNLSVPSCERLLTGFGNPGLMPTEWLRPPFQ